jgi:MOSC domain-containing protein YiiM
MFPFFRCPTPRLTHIYLTAQGGGEMLAVESASAELGKGLVGDRYHAGKGYWHPVESCQVTLISEHDLQQTRKRLPVPLENGEHRRNLVVSGLKTNTLRGKRFRIGSALFEYHKPRPPCGYINQLTGENMTKAMGLNSGVCLRVLESGVITAYAPT